MEQRRKRKGKYLADAGICFISVVLTVFRPGYHPGCWPGNRSAALRPLLSGAVKHCVCYICVCACGRT